MYTKADAEKAAKTLFFEGAGCVERGDIENCRIRTAFRNDKGAAFYLELSGFEVTKKSPAYMREYVNAGFVDYCYELLGDGFKDENARRGIEHRHFEYSKAGILEFVNRECGCSFDRIIITDMFDGYVVHKLNGGVNFMEDFEYNPKKAMAARMAFDEIDLEIKKRLGARYSQISLVKVGADFIQVRCYASDEKMRAAYLDPNERYFMVKIGGCENA